MVRVRLQKEQLPPVSDEQWVKTRWAYREKIPKTPQEDILWEKLCDKRLGFEFVRQYPPKDVKAFLDFYCRELKLAVEVDGGIHFTGASLQKDMARQRLLEDSGVLVVRFTNDQVSHQLPYVVGFIKQLCALRAQVLERTKSSGKPSETGASGAAGNRSSAEPESSASAAGTT